MQLRGSAGA
jgi:hypothetical protein